MTPRRIFFIPKGYLSRNLGNQVVGLPPLRHSLSCSSTGVWRSKSTMSAEAQSGNRLSNPRQGYNFNASVDTLGGLLGGGFLMYFSLR
jgi:archaellum component FlaC